jgi:thioredoxin reductase (NADPH)
MANLPDLYDVVIIGGGPGGMTAALYSARGESKTLIVCKGALGGTMLMTQHYQNFPGYPGGVATFELAQRFEKHMMEFGPKFEMDDVTALRYFEGGPLFEVVGDNATYVGKTVIVATGSTPKLLDAPGLRKLFGRGVSTCAVCDGAFYRGKDVAVVGGGDSAVEEAIYLTRFASSVKLIHRRNEFRACPSVVKAAFDNPKIEFVLESVIEEVYGQTKVEGLRVKHVKTGKEKKLDVTGLFVYVGASGNSEFIELEIDKTPEGYIKTNAHGETNIPGLFAIGDVRDEPYKQAVIACGHAAAAALTAEKYVKAIPVEVFAKFD